MRTEKELELMTQVEMLKTDMGKLQTSLRDAIVERDNTRKILVTMFEKTLAAIEKGGC
jgi:hypothetical protein